MPWYHFESNATWLTKKIEAFVYVTPNNHADDIRHALMRLQNDDPAWRWQHIRYLGTYHKPPHMSRNAYAAGMYIRETKTPSKPNEEETADG